MTGYAIHFLPLFTPCIPTSIGGVGKGLTLSEAEEGGDDDDDSDDGSDGDSDEDPRHDALVHHSSSED